MLFFPALISHIAMIDIIQLNNNNVKLFLFFSGRNYPFLDRGRVRQE